MRQITVASWQATHYQKRLIQKVLNSGRLTYGPVTRQLEQEFGKIHGHKEVLFTDSGTSALMIALRTMKDMYGWKDGAEVIMPAVTFVATMNVILFTNLKPVLVDIDRKTLNIDPNLALKAVTGKTVAIMPVHLLGLPANMKKINEIASRYDLKVIEDSCETMFISHPKGDITCYSSYLAHLMVTGVGGFIGTNNTELADYMRSMQFHGRDNSYLSMDDNSPEVVHKRFLFDKQGYSARATEMEAALGLGELKMWKKNIAKRQDNARYLQKRLAKYAFSPVRKDHAYMMFPMIVDDRDKLMEWLESFGIHTRTIMPLTNQPIVKKLLGNIEDKFPIAKWCNNNGLLVGCHQYLKKDDLDFIVDKIEEFYV